MCYAAMAHRKTSHPIGRRHESTGRYRSIRDITDDDDNDDNDVPVNTTTAGWSRDDTVQVPKKVTKELDKDAEHKAELAKYQKARANISMVLKSMRPVIKDQIARSTQALKTHDVFSKSFGTCDGSDAKIHSLAETSINMLKTYGYYAKGHENTSAIIVSTCCKV